jgi:WD40 repeat protein
MRRFNFINQSTLFTPLINASFIAKRQVSAPGFRDCIVHDNVTKLIKDIHDANFSGEFSNTDIANLRSDLARSTKHYYQLLDINPELEKSIFERELKQKYRALCFRFHPDCTAGHALKAEIFKLVQDAYETLSDSNFRGDHHCSSFSESDPFLSFWSSSRKNPVLGTTLFSLSKEDEINGVSISECGQYIAALTYKKLVIFDAKKNTLLHQFSGNYIGITRLFFSADSKKIAFCNDLSFNMLTLKTGRCIRKYVPPRRFVSSFCQSMLRLNNGNFVSTSEHGSLEIWHGQTGGHIGTLQGHTKAVLAMSIIPNSDHIISCSSDTTMKVWNMDVGICEHTFSGFNDINASTIAFSPDTKYLVASAWGQFSILDFERKQLIKQFKGYEWIQDRHGIQSAIKGILISLDSRYFASIANCPAVKIWEMESGKQVGEKTLPAYPQSVSHFGENILIGFDDGTISQFNFSDFGYERVCDQYMTLIR